MAIISWVHISDLHLEPTSWDASRVLESLLEDISGLPDKIGVKPDFALIAGDIANKGKAEEYEVARTFFDRFLEASAISKDRLFVAPGNHDVNRKVVTPVMLKLQGKLKSRDVLNQVLRDSSQWAVLFGRLQNFASFVESYFGSVRFFDHEWMPKPVSFVVNGVTIVVACFNSAWLSRAKNEQNKLCVGEFQARSVTGTAGNAMFRIGLLHHPMDWLAAFDKADVEPILLGQYDFLLHGHVHVPEFRRFVSPDYDTTVIGAGAAYETRLNRNGYNVVSLDTGQGRGAIYFRAYSDRQGGFWAADPSVYESVPDGCYQFEIPSRLKVSTVGFGKTLLHWQISLKKHHSLLWEDRSWSGAGLETYPVHPNNEDSLWAILAALRRGQSVEILGSKTGISIEVLQRLHDRVDMERSLLSTIPLTPELLIKAKKMGFTFEEIGTLVDKHSEQVRELCRTWNLPIDSYLEPDVPDLAFLLPSSTF